MYVLASAALLVPAIGIAYLGVMSSSTERGAIAAQGERQRANAVAIAAQVELAIEQTLDTVDRAASAAAQRGRATVNAPLGAYWFWIDHDQRLRVPDAAQAADAEEPAGLDKAAPCGAGTPLEECVRELATRETRVAKLRAAQRAEACHGDACADKTADAKRQYTALAASADAGPAALLGLARVFARTGDAANAASALSELERRFPERTFDGLPVPLVTATLRATTAAARLDLAAAVLADRYTLAPYQRMGVLARLRALLADGLSPAEVDRRDALDVSIADLRLAARTAAGLAADIPEIVRTALPQWQGRSAVHEPARTLIYRRRADGGVIGFAVDAPALERVAGPLDANAVVNARALVIPVGEALPDGWRRIAQVPLAEGIPNLALTIVNPLADPDPYDEMIGQRSRRRVIYTVLLALALAAGLLLVLRSAERQRELAQLKSDFVSTVSHELKTPLTSIRMFAEMLEQGVAAGDPAKMARYHGVIVQESQRLGLLIANLLDYAQIEKGTRRYTPSRHDIAALARHAVTTFETLRDPEGQRNTIEVDVSSESAHSEIEVDRDVVVQAVLNLLANAAKYGGTDSPIEVAAGADDSTAWIAVRDHGPGIPPAELPRIFREFYRSPEAYRSGVEGTGLGLALVKRHIEALGGTVEVASEVGRGATFTLRFSRVMNVSEVA